jgi:four helix bundle protein
MKGYRDLQVWAKGMAFAELVFALSKIMPKDEQYRITAQMLRSAAFVPANIAEGYQRSTRRDFAHFVSIARGSLAETETFLLLASRVGLLAPEATRHALELAEELSRMLFALRRSLIESPTPPPPEPDPGPLVPDPRPLVPDPLTLRRSGHMYRN